MIKKELINFINKMNKAHSNNFTIVEAFHLGGEINFEKVDIVTEYKIS